MTATPSSLPRKGFSVRRLSRGLHQILLEPAGERFVLDVAFVTGQHWFAMADDRCYANVLESVPLGGQLERTTIFLRERSMKTSCGLRRSACPTEP